MDDKRKRRNGNRGSGSNSNRGNKRGNDRRASSGKDDRFADDRRDDRTAKRQTGSLNDLSWYSRYPDLLASAGAIPYPYRPGMTQPTSDPLTITPEVGNTTVTKVGTAQIPGVMALDWIPSVGRSNSVTDPASIVCKEMYARVRAAFSGSLDADAPDFLMYVMALDSIFAFIAHMKRIYRTISVWTPQNYVLPDTLLRAFGCSDAFIADVRQNKTQFWGQINELIYQSRKFTCPAVMDIFNRHYWMSDNVYGDSPEANAQFYCFRPAGLFQFEELPLANDPQTNGSGLHMVKLPSFATGTAMYEFGRSLIEALVAWDEAYTINGYLLKAYADTPTFVVQALAQDETLVPVYVPEVLAQIENSTVATIALAQASAGVSDLRNPSATTIEGLSQDVLSGCNVVQDVTTNAVIANPTLGTMVPGGLAAQAMITAGFFNDSPMISVRTTTPTVADTVIASRLKCATDKATARTITTGFTLFTITVIAGTEIPLAWSVYAPQQLPILQRIWRYRDKNVNSDITAGLPAYMIVEQFDWHPFIRMDMISGTSADFANYGTIWIGDVHNSTVISSETLRQLHRVCVYSEFNAFNA